MLVSGLASRAWRPGIRAGIETALQMHQQQRDSRGRDSRDTSGLPERIRLVTVELLLRLDGKSAHLAVIEAGRQSRGLELLLTLDLIALAFDVSLVLDLDLYLLGGLLVCSHCGERLVARPRTGGKRRYACAKGVGFSGCGKTYINADDVEHFVTEVVLHRVDSGTVQRSFERRQRKEPDAQRWLDEAEQTQTELAELAEMYGRREFSLQEWMAARKPIEQRLTNARKQLAKVSRSGVLDRYIGNGKGLRNDWNSLDLSQQHAIVANVIDKVIVGPARPGYNRFDESRLTPRFRP